MATRMANRTHFGTIKGFNPEKGWGHIDCEETRFLYGKDMFVLRSQLVGMDVVRKGDQVQFTVQDGAKGPEAANVQLINTPTGAYHQDMSCLAGVEGSLSATTCVGIVKSFNPEKGWGHIECEATYALFGKDVFLMRSHLVGGQDVSKGQQVSFSFTQGSRGPEAENVRILPRGGSCFSPVAFGHNVPLLGMASTQAFTGTIKSYNEEKGWGHIACDATRAVYQKDIFFMRSSLNGATVSVGDIVQFGITMELKGPEASSIIVLTQLSQRNGHNSDLSEVYIGVVKMYNPEKGWGFLVSAESQRDWGKDIFVQSKEFAGVMPRQGDTFEFSVMPGKDGRPEAHGVVPVSAGDNKRLFSYGGQTQRVHHGLNFTPY